MTFWLGMTLFSMSHIFQKLPFRVAEHGMERFEAIHSDYSPYVHQNRAYERLVGEDPQSTLVATGTGSGKTECFLYPILEYCYQHRSEKGIKALIIYPMNALASDQATVLNCFANALFLRLMNKKQLFCWDDFQEYNTAIEPSIPRRSEFPVKKCLVILLALAALLLLSGLAVAEPAYCPYDIHLSIQYNHVSAPMQQLYDRLYDALYQGETVVKVPSGLTRDDAWYAMDFIVNEAPELCAFYRNGSRIVERNGGLEIELAYNLPLSTQQRFMTDIARTVKSFKGKGDSRGIRAIHDNIIRTFEYGWSDVGDTQLAYYALLAKKAVCNGYAQTMVMYAHFAGYTCSYIDGDVLDDNGAYSGRHAWNIACIDGRYVWLDATWDDKGKKAASTWYALDSASMRKTHRPDPEYNSLLNLSTVLPQNVGFNMHLDVNNANGYVRGLGQKSGMVKRQRDLAAGEYYSPAGVIYNNTSSPVTVTISYCLDGVYDGWGPYTTPPGGTWTAFRLNKRNRLSKTGAHSITWYSDGMIIGTFTWTVR